jgi:hypothetical protein
MTQTEYIVYCYFCECEGEILLSWETIGKKAD